jgi:triosephosphate isomerase
MIVINLKNYKVGKDILDLVKKIEIYYNKAIVAVPALNLKEISANTSLHIIAQHVDFRDPGRGTGYVIPEALLGAGIGGSLLNHSEHKLDIEEIKKTIKRCNEIGLKLIVCTSSLTEARKLKTLNPYAIAFEDKKLIATGKSITDYKTHDVRKFVEILKDSEIIPLCGAGITKGEDVAAALVLGCKGVLVASAVANSQHPENFLKEIASLF